MSQKTETPNELKVLTKRALDLLQRTVLDNPYIPVTPTPRQALFLVLPHREILYGGAAGGGKSTALLMAALQYVHVPGYAALLLRRTYADLSLPKALMPVSFEWLRNTDARWVPAERAWHFPSGAVIKFGYLDDANDIWQYQSSEFQFIGFDELTQFREFDYRYLFSRLRRLQHAPVPLRMRAGTNPGGLGHEWVRARFIRDAGRTRTRAFVPATLKDNPYLDTRGYLASLRELDPVTRRQLQLGDWEADRAGNMFQRGWFKIVRPGEVPRLERACRYWDLAASTPKAGADPDYTVGALVGIKDGIYWVADLVRLRGTPKMVEETIAATAKRDGITVMIRMEQEPGAAGLSLADHYARNVVPGYNFSSVRISGDKVARAGPFSAAAERGHVYVVEARWNQPFFDELEAFPEGDHDDQVDAVSGAIEALRQEAVWTARDVADALDAMRTSAHSGVDMFETPGLFDTANESLLFQ